MIFFLASGFCYLAFLLFESFAIGLDRISSDQAARTPRGAPGAGAHPLGSGGDGDHPDDDESPRPGAPPGGPPDGRLGLQSLGVEPAWAWGGSVFLLGWLASEVMLLKFGASADAEKTSRACCRS